MASDGSDHARPPRESPIAFLLEKRSGVQRLRRSRASSYFLALEGLTGRAYRVQSALAVPHISPLFFCLCYVKPTQTEFRTLSLSSERWSLMLIFVRMIRTKRYGFCRAICIVLIVVMTSISQNDENSLNVTLYMQAKHRALEVQRGKRLNLSETMNSKGMILVFQY